MATKGKGMHKMPNGKMMKNSAMKKAAKSKKKFIPFWLKKKKDKK